MFCHTDLLSGQMKNTPHYPNQSFEPILIVHKIANTNSLLHSTCFTAHNTTMTNHVELADIKFKYKIFVKNLMIKYGSAF